MCYCQFKSKDDLRTHWRGSSQRCDVRDPQPLEGLNEQQIDLLKSRDRNKSKEERWKAVYKICFPEDQVIPSPCKSTSLSSLYSNLFSPTPFPSNLPISVLNVSHSSSGKLTSSKDYIHHSEEVELLRRNILARARQWASMENLERDQTNRLLQHLRDVFHSHAQRPRPSLPPTISRPSSNDTFLPPAVAPTNPQPPLQPSDITHGFPTDTQDNNFVTGDAPADVMNLGDYIFDSPEDFTQYAWRPL